LGNYLLVTANILPPCRGIRRGVTANLRFRSLASLTIPERINFPEG
jgi:hypothetical protein